MLCVNSMDLGAEGQWRGCVREANPWSVLPYKSREGRRARAALAEGLPGLWFDAFVSCPRPFSLTMPKRRDCLTGRSLLHVPCDRKVAAGADGRGREAGVRRPRFCSDGGPCEVSTRRARPATPVWRGGGRLGAACCVLSAQGASVMGDSTSRDAVSACDRPGPRVSSGSSCSSPLSPLTRSCRRELVACC